MIPGSESAIYGNILTWVGLQRLYGQEGVRVCFLRWRDPALQRSRHKRLCARDQLELRAEWEPEKSWRDCNLYMGSDLSRQDSVDEFKSEKINLKIVSVMIEVLNTSPSPTIAFVLAFQCQRSTCQKLVFFINSRNISIKQMSLTVQSSEPDTM